MTDVFPRRNLPDDGKGNSSEPWGREVEKRVINVETGLEMLSQSLSGQNRSTASSLTDLAAQVRDLRGRVGYAVDGTGITQTWTSLQPDNQPWGAAPSLTFTLTESRTVSIQSAIRTVVNAQTSTNTSYALAAARGMLFVNGSGLGGARGEVGVSVDPLIGGPNARQDYSLNTLMCRSLVVLPAGTHTVQLGFNYRNVEISGSGSAYFRASDPNLFIDVLQTAG